VAKRVIVIGMGGGMTVASNCFAFRQKQFETQKQNFASKSLSSFILFQFNTFLVFNRVKIAIWYVFYYFVMCSVQRNTEVRWPPGQETSLVSLCSNLRFFGSKFTALRKYLQHC